MHKICTVEFAETVDGDTRGSCGELEQTRLVLRVERADKLPEPLDHIVAILVVAVDCVLAPVVHVNIGNTADEQLKLALIKDRQQLLGDDLVQTGLERLQLQGDALLDTEIAHQSGILLLVLLGHSNIAAVGNQVMRRHFAKLFLVGREGQIEDVGNVILPIVIVFLVHKESKESLNEKKKAYNIHLMLR